MPTSMQFTPDRVVGIDGFTSASAEVNLSGPTDYFVTLEFDNRDRFTLVSKDPDEIRAVLRGVLTAVDALDPEHGGLGRYREEWPPAKQAGEGSA